MSLWLFCLCLPLFPQTERANPPGGVESDETDLLGRARQLYSDERFCEIEHMLARSPHTELGSELLLLLGLARARQGNWAGTERPLQEAAQRQPDHVAARLELAGVQYRLKRNWEAIENLRRALELDAGNEYARRFLAALLSLEDRQIKALDHWNEVGDPRLRQIAYRVSGPVDSELLTRLFPINEGEVLRAERVRDVQWTQSRFGLGSPARWQLTPSKGRDWELEIVVPDRSGLSLPRSWLLENSAGALVESTLSLDHPRGLSGGPHWRGSFRWDPPRRRLQTTVGWPFVSAGAEALRLGLDMRREEWNARFSETSFRLENEVLFAQFEHLFPGRRSLTFVGSYQHQRTRIEGAFSPVAFRNPHLAEMGAEWNQILGWAGSDNPRIEWTVQIKSISGWGHEKLVSPQVSSGAYLTWKPWPEDSTRLQIGGSTGFSGRHLPLTHYFVLCVGPDGVLPLRAHPTTEKGSKGNSPLGRHYALLNLEARRDLGRWGVFRIRGLAFSDTAVLAQGPFGRFEKDWWQDVGGGFHLNIFGLDLIEILLGFDLRDSAFNLWLGLPRN